MTATTPTPQQVKYADNIVKGFATSISILLSGVISIYLIPALRFEPSAPWMCGSVLVVAATVLYSAFD